MAETETGVGMELKIRRDPGTLTPSESMLTYDRRGELRCGLGQMAECNCRLSCLLF